MSSSEFIFGVSFILDLNNYSLNLIYKGQFRVGLVGGGDCNFGCEEGLGLGAV